MLKIVFILDGKMKKVCLLTITKTSHASTAVDCFKNPPPKEINFGYSVRSVKSGHTLFVPELANEKSDLFVKYVFN